MKKTSRRPKGLVICFLIFYLAVTLLPPLLYRALPAPENAPPSGPSPEPSPSPGQTASPQPAPTASPLPGPLDKVSESDQAVFTLYDTATDETIEVAERDLLAAGLACEMDLHAPEEALKAQAVAACTYYRRARESGQEISCDRESWLVYVDEARMRERWGEDYEEYKSILDKIVDEVYGQVLTYNDELILAAYFAISPGSTEDVENVWAGDSDLEHPYLQAVASPGDVFSDGYLSYAEFTAGELREAFPGAELSGEPEGWVEVLERTPAGMVKSARVGGVEASGAQARSALGLRSACFSCQAADGKVRFTVKGWGHGVGMSQAGAVFMAKRRASYEEILGHYYPGAVLDKQG